EGERAARRQQRADDEMEHPRVIGRARPSHVVADERGDEDHNDDARLGERQEVPQDLASTSNECGDDDFRCHCNGAWEAGSLRGWRAIGAEWLRPYSRFFSMLITSRADSSIEAALTRMARITVAARINEAITRWATGNTSMLA